MSLVITLCGSARFERHFHAWSEALAVCGQHAVFGLAVYPSHKGEKNWYDDATKEALDAAHRAKIDASDAILVLNVFAYTGDSTESEIMYAIRRGKRVYALESWAGGNGIGTSHNIAVIEAAESYGVYPHRSRIDTTMFKHPYDLLGPADALRSRYVDYLDSLKTEKQ